MSSTQLFISFVLWLLTGYLIGRWSGRQRREALEVKLEAAMRALGFGGYTETEAALPFTYVGGPWDGDAGAGDLTAIHAEGGTYSLDREGRAYIWTPE